MRTALFLLLSTLAAAVSIPQQVPLSDELPGVASADDDASGGGIPSPRPLVIWHGLGDTAHSDGMDEFIGIVRTRYPGIFVHSVVAPVNADPGSEQQAGWWGKAESLAEEQCAALAEIPELKDGYDAIGFSQGGLFLRYVAQYCEHGDRMRNLITFGSPHYGINALIPCPDPPTLACKLAYSAARAGVYTLWAQRRLIQAQYYRDVDRLDEFLLYNTFIRDLNGEGILDDDKTGREYGGRGLDKLENLVAVNFLNDTTVFPARSSQWSTLAPEEEDEQWFEKHEAKTLGDAQMMDVLEKRKVIPLREQPLYEQDWIGLKALDKKKRLHLVDCPGQHMQLGGEGGCADKLLDEWVGWDEKKKKKKDE